MGSPANRRRRLARWAVLWLAVLNFLLWTVYSHSARPRLSDRAAHVQTVVSRKA